MKNLKLISLFVLVLMATSVVAQPEDLPADLKPGMTPDSLFYFLDVMFDVFQSSESLANEKVAEVALMAQEKKLEALEKAREKYEKAMEKRSKESEKSEEDAEEVARQASKHMEVLAKVYEKVPEEAKQGIENAMKNSAKGRANSVNALKNKNKEKGEKIERETEEELSDIPEEFKDLLKVTEMKEKYSDHLNALSKSYECGLLPATINVEGTEYTPEELLNELDSMITAAESEEDTEKAKDLVEEAKDIADKISNQYGRGKGYWENVGVCPSEERSPNDVGKPEYAGKPDDIGKPDNVGKPDDIGKPDNVGKPDDTGPDEKEEESEEEPEEEREEESDEEDSEKAKTGGPPADVPGNK